DLLLDSVAEKYYLGEKGIEFVTREKNLKKQYTQINGEIMLCQKANQQFNWHGDFIFEKLESQNKIEGKEVEEKNFLYEKIVYFVMYSGTKNYYIKPNIVHEVMM